VTKKETFWVRSEYKKWHNYEILLCWTSKEHLKAKRKSLVLQNLISLLSMCVILNTKNCLPLKKWKNHFKRKERLMQKSPISSCSYERSVHVARNWGNHAFPEMPRHLRNYWNTYAKIFTRLLPEKDIFFATGVTFIFTFIFILCAPFLYKSLFKAEI